MIKKKMSIFMIAVMTVSVCMFSEFDVNAAEIQPVRAENNIVQEVETQIGIQSGELGKDLYEFQETITSRGYQN